ncbi:MAG: DUF47 domain-containing protein [Candidatus Rokuibacteriota bacterium]
MRLFRKDCDFFQMLAQQVAKTLEGVETLKQFVDSMDAHAGNRVKSIEEDADEIRRLLIQELNQTFVTPIDREDIFSLSRAIDDVLDYCTTTVYEFEIYELKPDDRVKVIVGILLEAAKELRNSVKHLKEYPRLAGDHAVLVKGHENRMELAYRMALAELFRGSDAIYMMKMREIYRHLSNAADRADEAANVIHNIVVKRG